MLTAQSFQSKSLRFFCMFFSYTLAYDTVSIKFDFASIWRSMDEYIEYCFQKNAVTDHSHACCNTVNQQKQGEIGIKI